MAIRAVVFDIGGVLEITPRGGDPAHLLPEMIARWESRLGLEPGVLDARITAMDTQLKSVGKDGELGTISEEEWVTELARATELNPEQLDAFLRDFWDVYLGAPNAELIAYFASLRPAYTAALLSNSMVGAREQEEERYHFAEMTDLIVYSHEVGMAKPDRRIYELTCERLGIEPAETLFVDDAPVNIAAAQAVGIHTILCQTTKQVIADIQAALEVHHSADNEGDAHAR